MADVLSWTITDNGAGFQVTLALGSIDEFLIEQAPRFDIDLRFATRGLHWRKQPAEVANNELIFRTGRIGHGS